MAYNGSGTFVRIYDWTDDAANDIDIDATRMDAEMDGMATGLSTALTKDGQTNPTADLPMAGFNHTGVGNAAARDEYAAAGQIQDESFTWCGTAGGTANALTLTPSPAITAYTTGQRFVFKSGASPSTSTVTVAISGLTTKAIQSDGAALSSTVVIEADKWYSILYDGAAFQISKLALPSSGAPYDDATAIVKGSSDATKLVRFEVDGLTTATTRVITVPDTDLTLLYASTGTFTPTLTTTGTDFDSVTYDAARHGQYVKIGTLVHVQLVMSTDAVTVGSASGSVIIDGLPFTALAGGSGTQEGSAPLAICNVNSWAGEEPIAVRVIPNTTQIELKYRAAVDGNESNTVVADVSTSANSNNIHIAGTYIAAS